MTVESQSLYDCTSFQIDLPRGRPTLEDEACFRRFANRVGLCKEMAVIRIPTELFTKIPCCR
jgi:hypothetical protein